MSNERYIRYHVEPRSQRPASSPGVWLELEAGAAHIEWIIYIADSAERTAIETRIRSAMEVIRRMPTEHLRVLDAILIVDRLPGGRATGGGYWTDSEVNIWLNREGRTGVPAADIRWHTSRYRRNRAGIIAITKAAMLADIYMYSILHEVAHSVDHHLDLVPSSATLNDFRGVRYPAPRIGEYAAEAYARFMINPNRVCRIGSIPGGENMATCSQRLIALLRTSPAFASIQRDWTPS